MDSRSRPWGRCNVPLACRSQNGLRLYLRRGSGVILTAIPRTRPLDSSAHTSGGLADDPENILLLCDPHHRLVDTVARADYPAAILSAMRRRFCEAATALLDALALAPTPAFCVAWPVHRQRIALPSSQQVARALKPIGARLDGQLRTVNDNEAVLRSLEGEGPLAHDGHGGRADGG